MSTLTARRKLTIEAPPEVVWKVHTDINAWSQWQSAISVAHAVTPLAVGSTFDWKSGGLSIASTVQTLIPNQKISWTGKSLGTQANHTWVLQAKNGGTVVNTEESMTGWLVSLLRLFAPKFLDKSLDVWLLDLKNKAEAINKESVSSR